MVHTIYWGDEIPKEAIHYTCLASINIGSVMKIDKNNYPQVYLEEWKYEINKKKMVRFINTELELDDSDSSDFELSSNVFRRIQIWDKEEKDGQIYKHWVRVRWFW